MNILVTGGAGYIGTPLVVDLLSKGHNVRVFDMGLYGFEQILSFIHLSNFELRIGDIRNENELLDALNNINVVIHLAALVGEDACNIDHSATKQINESSVQCLLKCCDNIKGLQLIFLSTCSNYGVAKSSQLADEETELKPLSLYAKTKVAAEKAILSSDGNCIVTVLRLGTICGLSPRMRFDLLISELAIRAVQNKKIEIYKPEAWRPFVHLKDAITAINLILRQPQKMVNRKVFNVVKENLKKRNLGEIVEKHYPNVAVEYTSNNPDERDYRVSGARIQSELGHRCIVTVEEAFLETAKAIENGFFRDLNWIGHSALPLPEFSKLISTQDGK